VFQYTLFLKAINMGKSKKILMLVGDFVEDYEAMVPFQMLLMMGHKVDTVCPNKEKGDHVATAIHDFDGFQTYSEKRGHNFPITEDFESVQGESYDALVIPGGRSPEYLRMNKQVLELVKYFFEVNKPVAAICHAMQILVSANVLQGRSCTAYPTVADEIRMAGGTFVPNSHNFDNAYTDGNLVTGPAWPAHPAWIGEFLNLLGTPVGK
jgi:protease I